MFYDLGSNLFTDRLCTAEHVVLMVKNYYLDCGRLKVERLSGQSLPMNIASSTCALLIMFVTRMRKGPVAAQRKPQMRIFKLPNLHSQHASKSTPLTGMDGSLSEPWSIRMNNSAESLPGQIIF